MRENDLSGFEASSLEQAEYFLQSEGASTWKRCKNLLLNGAAEGSGGAIQ